MIYTWGADITPLLDKECYRKYYIEAPFERKKKADCLKSMKSRAQSIGVWSVYAKMKQFYKLDGSEAHNFSHSGNYVLCSACVGQAPSFSKTAVGCDVEKIRECRLKLAKRFFCEPEYRYLLEKEDEEQRKAFYRYWVLKESFMKAVGKGMALGMDTFEIRLGEPSVLVKQPEEFQQPFYYMESELGCGEYRAAVCSTDSEIDTKVRVIQLGVEYEI